MTNKKRGRPFLDNPKSVRIDVRLTKEDFAVLDAYCKKNGVTHAQGMRDGIRALEEK